MNAEYQVFEVDSKYETQDTATSFSDWFDIIREAIVSGNDEEDPLPRKTTLQKCVFSQHGVFLRGTQNWSLRRILGVCCQNTCLSRISSQWLDDRYEGLDDDSMHSLDKVPLISR